jgi:hypothetical protein
LVTETVATIGLDYWYLSTFNINDICNIGTSQGPLTTPYRLQNEGEYRRFNPAFTAQDADFFSTLCRFYCDGVMPGFTLQSLRQSPLTLKWLRHELEYGESQRVYTRAWFNYLSNFSKKMSRDELARPLKIEKIWQAKLIKAVEETLWAKIKEGRNFTELATLRVPAFLGKRGNEKKPNLFFNNLNFFAVERVASLLEEDESRSRGQFRYFFRQFVSAHDYSSFDQEKIKLFPALSKAGDYKKLLSLFKNEKRCSPFTLEPKDLLFLS